MPEPRPTISTHVLDTGRGAPAAGVRVHLWRRPANGGPTERLAGEATTDADGRVRDLLAGEPLEAGEYRLEFEFDAPSSAAGSPGAAAGSPGAATGTPGAAMSAGGGFFTGLSVGLRIDDPTRSYHVPLLRAPFGLSTYRGS